MAADRGLRVAADRGLRVAVDKGLRVVVDRVVAAFLLSFILQV